MARRGPSRDVEEDEVLLAYDAYDGVLDVPPERGERREAEVEPGPMTRRLREVACWALTFSAASRRRMIWVKGRGGSEWGGSGWGE